MFPAQLKLIRSLDTSVIEPLQKELAQKSSEYEEFPEPHITSTDSRERKLARRLRILRRLEAIRKLHLPPGEIVPEEVKQTIVEKQIDESWDKLQKKIFIGDEYITNIRIANESREVQRRKELIAEQKRISSKLEAEGRIAEEMFHKLSEGWPELTISNDPLYIDNGLAQQKLKCDELLKRKNDLLEMLDYELKFKDTRYIQDEICMRQDIRTMADRIDRQALLMRKSFQHELALIEEAIVQERLEVMDSHKKRLDNLIDMRDKTEGENLETKMKQLDEHQVEMYRLLQKHQEVFREVRIHLDNDIENLQKELQNLRALCLINSETMDYNYQILKRREEENVLVKSTQQRKINKLQDVVNQIRKRIEQFTKESNVEIQKLTEEVIKLNSSIIEVESKDEQFSRANDRKYREIWNMNTNEAQELLKKILNIDKIIHEQQLGITWKAPEMPNSVDLLSIHESKDDVQDTATIKSEPHNTDIKEESAKSALLARMLRLLATRTENLIEDRLKILLAPYSDNDTKIINLDNVFAALHIHLEKDMDTLLEYFLPYTYCPICIQNNIVSESISVENEEYLIDVKPTTSFQSAGQTVFSIKNLLRKVTDSQDKEPKTNELLEAIEPTPELINQILDTFTDDPKIRDSQTISNTISFSSKTSTSTSKTSSKTKSSAGDKKRKISAHQTQSSKLKSKYRCPKDHLLAIRPCYIIRAIKDFSLMFNYKKDKEFVTLETRLAKKHSTISRSITQQDVSAYWERYRHVFTDKKEQIWDALLIGLNKYHTILKDRKQLCSEVLGLRKQNAELRQLLHNLLDYSDFKFLPPLEDTAMPPHSSGAPSVRSNTSKESSLKFTYKYLEPKF